MKKVSYTKRELECFSPRFFLSVTVDGDCIHATSRITLDSWLIQKKAEGKGYYYCLYHQHTKDMHRAFHDHAQFRTLHECVQQIVGHDKWSNQRKDKSTERN